MYTKKSLSNIINEIEDKIQTKINSIDTISGGCICNSFVITDINHVKYFLKTKTNSDNLFRCENNGLIALKKNNEINTPKIIGYSENYLLLEFIETGIKNSVFFKNFGIQLAKMHKVNYSYFGFNENNFIGQTEQINIPNKTEKNNWQEFYWNKRLLFQINLAYTNKLLKKNEFLNFIKLENKIEVILKNSEESPSLIHGDLWSGNYICDQNQTPYLIDPAVYYGHREAELAMTKLFGGFTPEFYYFYNQTYPLKDGFEDREPLYKLYHILNHLNLFGRNYIEEAKSILMFYGI